MSDDSDADFDEAMKAFLDMAPIMGELKSKSAPGFALGMLLAVYLLGYKEDGRDSHLADFIDMTRKLLPKMQGLIDKYEARQRH